MKRTAILVSLIFIVVSLFFFYPIFKGKIPFPGDLLVGEYAPYSSYPFLGYAPGGYPNKGQDFDVIRLLYPEKEFSIRMFQNFEFPLWNSYNFSGSPHIASLQSGSFYPLNILFFMFPYVLAWTIFIVLQPVLTGIFSFLFARELKLGIKNSIFSGLLFAFSSYYVVWMEYGNIGHSIIWMPFAMWMSLKNLKKPTVLKSIAISLSLLFSILAGYAQTAFYVFIFLAAFVIFNIFFIDKEGKFKKLLIFCLIFILPILLSAMQLLPMIELFFQSARAPYPQASFLKLLIPLFHAVTIFVPDFFGNPATRNYWLSGTYIERVIYIGVIPIIFVLYSFFKKQNSTFWFFAISAIVILLLTFDTFIGRIIYSFQIPFISTAVPTRIMFLYLFCVSIIAGFGMDTFEKDLNKKPVFKAILILGGVYIFLWILIALLPLIDKSWIQNLSISRRNLLLPTFIFFVSAIVLHISFYRVRYKKFIIIFLVILSMGDLFYFFHKITPFAPKETVYPQTEILTQLKKIQGIDRSWGYGSGYINTNLQTYEKTFSVDGYNALHLKRYGELISSSMHGRIANSIPGSDVVIASGYGGSDLRENKYRQRLLNLLGVKYVLNKVDPPASAVKADNQTFDDSIYKLIWQKTPWQIYENKEVLPRIFLASNYVVESDKNKIIQMIFDEKFDFRNRLILEEPVLPRLQLPSAKADGGQAKIDFSKDDKAKVEVKKYTPNEILLQTDAKTNMLLFISDNYYKGWRVSIDGEFGKIYRANYSFRAVPVVKGDHEIIFSYYPKSFDLGLKISIGSLILSVILIILAQIKRFYYVKK
ncbi:MAG: YfhO family protein [Candidatus Levybacteria bacterium]|nr:YfhO family protein [Candidatus Levybacteria bacterium]